MKTEYSYVTKPKFLTRAVPELPDPRSRHWAEVWNRRWNTWVHDTKKISKKLQWMNNYTIMNTILYTLAKSNKQMNNVTKLYYFVASLTFRRQFHFATDFFSSLILQHLLVGHCLFSPGVFNHPHYKELNFS